MTTITETLSLPHKIDHDQHQILQRHGRHCPGSCLPKPSLVPSTTPTPPGVPHHSVCYIVDASQDRSAAGAAGTSAAMRRSIETTPSNQHVLVQQKLYAGRFNQFGTPSSFGVGVPTRTTPRATREHKGKRLSAPGIGSFYPKPTVDLDLLLIYSNFWCDSGLRSQSRLRISHPHKSNCRVRNNTPKIQGL